jgi:hypothetical protein
MLVRFVIAAFLIAHGMIHTGFVSPRPSATAGGPPWPFDLGHSWVLTPLGADTELIRLVGTALVAATIGAFALAALAAVGPLPPGLWAPAVSLGAAASIGVLGLFFHPWLVVGIGLDAALLWAVNVAGWIPEASGL